MMDSYTIHALAEEAARAAKRAGKQPRVFSADELIRAKEGDRSAIRGIPNLGTLLPKGWKRVKLTEGRGVYEGDNEGFGAFFVDKSGCGGPGEPAISLPELIEQLRPGLGYGMVEEGQFQVKVGAFAVRTDGRGKRGRKS